MTRLTVTGLRKSFRDTPVLRGVDLNVEPSRLTAILGASGAGKTTLLRVIAGFEGADQGTVSLDGTVVDDGRRRTPPERRRIGYVPQDGALFPHMTVRANAAFSLPRGQRRGPRADEILRLVGLSGLGGRYPHQLSGGQQQRVALARALASRPRLVLLDEPFSSLDAALRATVRADVLGVLRSTGTTAILVTHDQDEALSAADDVAIMRDGVITQVGTGRDVYEHPADPWTASFVGTANLLPGSADGGEVRTALGRHRLHATLAETGTPCITGRRVTVLIRPEQIRLAAPRPDGITAHVADVSYYGHDAMVTVRPDGPGSQNGHGGPRSLHAGGQGEAGRRGTGWREEDGPGESPAPGRPGACGKPDVLHVRITRSSPPAPGERVGLDVRGDVVAWLDGDDGRP